MAGMATAQTGCGYDEQRVWSSSACGEGSYFTMAGQSDLYGAEYPKECTQKDAQSVYARCCADQQDDSESQAEAVASAAEDSIKQKELEIQKVVRLASQPRLMLID